MRENKFRIRNMNNKEILLYEKIVNNHWVYSPYPDKDFLPIEIKDYDVILQREQFTGLKDKNGKEIYEKDIVIATTDYYRNKEKEIPMEIHFEDYSFVIKTYKDIPTRRKGSYYLSTLKIYIDLEVIGNIYENPELLEEK